MTFTLLFSATSIAQNLECQDFREGSFFIESSMNGVDIRIEMSRTENTQVEYYGVEEVLYIDLEWIGDCTYKMILNEEKNKLDEVSMFINQNGGIFVTKKR